MISYLDNLNQSQLPRVWGCLLNLAQADSFHRSHFLQTFPCFSPPHTPISTPFLCVSSCCSPSISSSCLLESSYLLCVQVGVCSLPILSVTVWKPVKWDNLCTNTLHMADTWMLPLFFLLLPQNAKTEIAFLSNGGLNSESMFLFPFLFLSLSPPLRKPRAYKCSCNNSGLQHSH